MLGRGRGEGGRSGKQGGQGRLLITPHGGEKGPGRGRADPTRMGERVAELKGARWGKAELPPRSSSLLSQLQQGITFTLAIAGINSIFLPSPASAVNSRLALALSERVSERGPSLLAGVGAQAAERASRSRVSGVFGK